jgi:hypothetical protein
MKNNRPKRLVELFGVQDKLASLNGTFVIRWPETENINKTEIRDILRKVAAQQKAVLVDMELVKTQQVIAYPNSQIPKRRTYQLYTQFRYDPNKPVDPIMLKSAIISVLEPFGAKVTRAELGESILESLSVGDRVENGSNGERGKIVSVTREEDEESYTVQFDSGKKDTLERDMLVKVTESNENQLMKNLLEKLRGKSVYRTLKVISEKNIDSGPVALKGLFSLGTHIAIEMEQGNTEYQKLLPSLCNRIRSILVK